MSTINLKSSSPSVQPQKTQPSRQGAPQSPSPSPHSPQTSTRSSSSNGAQTIAYPYRVICQQCHKTVLFSGEDGEIFSVLCDECSGL